MAPALQGLPEVVIGGLDAGDAAALLASVATGRLSPEVESRLIAEGGGNPLALVELAAELTPAQLAGSAALPDPLPAAGSLQQMFSRRLAPAVARCPAAARHRGGRARRRRHRVVADG